MNTPAVSLLSSDGKRFDLVSDHPTRIGRGSDNDLVVPDKSVSRHHALITIKDGRCLVRDLESANGTFLAGRRISDAQLAHGDQVRFGDIEFILDNPAAAVVPMPKPWWQSRAIQASAAALIVAIALIGLLHHPAVDQSAQSSGTVTSALAGRNFDLPQASTDFVGDWAGALPLTSSAPSSFANVTSVEMGATFYVANGRVVMSVAAYAPPGMKITKMSASGIDDRHVLLEEEALEKDTLGEPLWDRMRIELALGSAGMLDCTETHDYYRTANGSAIARVIYQGPLKRVSEAERKRGIEEMERKGLKKQGETTAPVLKR